MKKLLALIFSLSLLLGGCSVVDGLMGALPGQSTSVESVESSSDDSESFTSESEQPNEELPEEEEKTEEEKPEVEQPEEELPEEEKPEVEQPEEELPEEEKPEVEQPEEELPEEEKPEAHDYHPVVTKPTCEEEGYTTYTCSICGDSYLGNQVQALGHSYNSVVTKPTCTTNGYTKYTCTACGDSYTGNKTSYLGHKYNAVTTPATCEEDGYTTYTCSACGDSYEERTSMALGHSYQAVVVKPTCTANGYTTYTCATCGDSYEANEVQALGHSWVDATTEAPKTCKTCGKTEGDKLPATPSNPTLDTLYVHYIDVGQGDSILISVDHCDILIDAGVANQGRTVSNYLKKQGVDDVELMINTHPDADHCGGLTQVLTDFVVEEVWASPLTKTTQAYKNFASAVTKEGLKMKTPSVGTVFAYEALTLTVLYNGEGTSDANDSSIVVMVEYEEYRFLFTGDISSTIETKLVNSKVDLSCDVLKVAHHGSKYSSDSSFLRATGAQYGVICVGTGNDYGHPTSATLNRLASAKIDVYRTDLLGSIVFSTDGVNLYAPS